MAMLYTNANRMPWMLRIADWTRLENSTLLCSSYETPAPLVLRHLAKSLSTYLSENVLRRWWCHAWGGSPSSALSDLSLIRTVSTVDSLKIEEPSKSLQNAIVTYLGARELFVLGQTMFSSSFGVSGTLPDFVRRSSSSTNCRMTSLTTPL
jgi:hypothetical protein